VSVRFDDIERPQTPQRRLNVVEVDTRYGLEMHLAVREDVTSSPVLTAITYSDNASGDPY